MSKHRNYIDEIIEKQRRHLKRVDRYEQFARRVVPLVKGFRHILAMDAKTDFRNEWLKYGAIGYIACVEGYFRMLVADLINSGDPYINRVSALRDVKISLEDVVAIHSKKVSLGEYVAHLLSLNGIQDINASMSVLIGEDFLKAFKAAPASERVSTPMGELFPKAVSDVDALFQLRHLYAHELAPKIPAKPRHIENFIGSTAMFIFHTEELVQRHYLL